MSSLTVGDSINSAPAARAPQVIERQASLNHLPPTLWSQPWTPSFNHNQMLTVNDLPNGVFDAATDNSIVSDFHVRGSSMTDLIQAFVTKIESALETGDFTDILTPDREFIMCVFSLFLMQIFVLK